MVPNTFRICGQSGFYGTKYTPLEKLLVEGIKVLLLSCRLISIWWCSFKVFVHITFVSPCSSETHQDKARKAILHTAVAIDPAIDDIVHCPVELGAVTFFFLDYTIYFTKARWQCKLIQLKKLSVVAEQWFEPCFYSIICLSNAWLLRMPVWMVFICKLHKNLS